MKLSSLTLSTLLLLYSSSCNGFSSPRTGISRKNSRSVLAAEADAKWKIKEKDSSDGPKMMDVDKKKTRTQRIMEKTPLEGQ